MMAGASQASVPHFSLDEVSTSTEVVAYPFFYNKIIYFLNRFFEKNDAATKDCLANHVVANSFNLNTALELMNQRGKRLTLQAAVTLSQVDILDLKLSFLLYGQGSVIFDLRESVRDTTNMTHRFQRWSPTGDSVPSFALYTLFTGDKQSSPWSGGYSVFSSDGEIAPYRFLQPLSSDVYHEDIRKAYPLPYEVIDPKNHRHRCYGVSGTPWSWGDFTGLSGAPILQIPFDEILFRPPPPSPAIVETPLGTLHCFRSFKDIYSLVASLKVPLATYVPFKESLLESSVLPEDIEDVSARINAIFCIANEAVQVPPEVLSNLVFSARIFVHTDDPAFSFLTPEEDEGMPCYKFGSGPTEHHLFYENNSYYALDKLKLEDGIKSAIIAPAEFGYFFDALQQTRQKYEIRQSSLTFRLATMMATMDTLSRETDLERIYWSRYNVTESEGTAKERLRRHFAKAARRSATAKQIKDRLQKIPLKEAIAAVESVLPVQIRIYNEAEKKMIDSRGADRNKRAVIAVLRPDGLLSLGEPQHSLKGKTPRFLLTWKNNLYVLQLAGEQRKRFMYAPLTSTTGMSFRYCKNIPLETNSNVFYSDRAELYEVFTSASNGSVIRMRLPANAETEKLGIEGDRITSENFYATGMVYKAEDAKIGVVTDVNAEQGFFEVTFDSLVLL